MGTFTLPVWAAMPVPVIVALRAAPNSTDVTWLTGSFAEVPGVTRTWRPPAPSRETWSETFGRETQAVGSRGGYTWKRKVCSVTL